MLQRDVNVRTDLLVCSNRLQQLARDLIWIRIQEPHPVKLLDLRQSLQQQCQPVLQAQVFAIAGRVLPNEHDLPHATLSEIFRFSNNRFKPARTEFPTQLRDDAKTARMVTSLS